MRYRSSFALFATCVLLAASPALAAEDGGDTSGSMSGDGASAYDPTADYQMGADAYATGNYAAADLKSLGATLVDMEVGAVAQAAARLGKPWAAIKAVTDEANGDSAGDSHANLVRAARVAARETERLVAMI